MSQRRRVQTLADYVVIALSPALIMLLVGSLVFFLQDIFYRGDHPGRLMWMLGLFVFGQVLVARIGIEEGVAHSQMFGLALLGAAGLFCLRFIPLFVPAMGLLLLVAWCSWRLTRDCTFIDDSVDSSGEGLLQAALAPASEPSPSSAARTGASEPAPPSTPLSTPSPSGPPRPPTFADPFETLPLSERLARASERRRSGRGASEEPAGSPAEPQTPARNSSSKGTSKPGTWVVFFSLAALPLFGLGQLFIPATDQLRRRYSFQLLLVYVAAALGLLLTTSFLGLRRYLRQRNLEMPAAVTRSWLGWGSVVGLLVLAVALLFPRPQGEYSVTDWVDRIDRRLSASNFAVLPGGAGEGQGRVVRAEPPPRAPQAPGPDAAGGVPRAQAPPAEPNAPGDAQPGGATPARGPAEVAQQPGTQPPADTPDAGEGSAPQGERQPPAQAQATRGNPPGNQPGQRSASQASRGQRPESQDQMSGDRSGQPRPAAGQSPGDNSPAARQGAGRPAEQPTGQPTGRGNDSQTKSGQPGDQPQGSETANRTAPDEQPRETPAEQSRETPAETQPSATNAPAGQSQTAPQQNPRMAPGSPPPPANAARPGGQPQPPNLQRPQPEKLPVNQQNSGTPAAPAPAVPPPPPQPPSPPGFFTQLLQRLAQFGGWFKWLFYGLLTLAAGWLLFRHGGDLWRLLLSLFGSRRSTAQESAQAPAAPPPPPRPFADFTNPFATGQARRMPLKELAGYSFLALEAWAREAQQPRSDEQTPAEFAQQIARRKPHWKTEVLDAADVYAQVAYAGRDQTAQGPEVFERLWRRLDEAAR